MLPERCSSLSREAFVAWKNWVIRSPNEHKNIEWKIIKAKVSISAGGGKGKDREMSWRKSEMILVRIHENQNFWD